MPLPITSASRIAQASPVPAHTWCGLDCDTASAPMACTGMESNTGRNVLPLSLDFHTPPDALPTYHVFGSPGTPTTAAMRPPDAGPSIWKRNGSTGLGRGRAPERGACCATAVTALPTKASVATKEQREEESRMSADPFVDPDRRCYRWP